MSSTDVEKSRDSIKSYHSGVNRTFSYAINNSKHNFVEHYFKVPTYCDFCSKLLKGVLSKQGVICTRCGYSAHFKCKEASMVKQCYGDEQRMSNRRKYNAIDKKNDSTDGKYHA